MDVPEDARTWKNRGDEYVGKEKYEEAIQCYAYAVQLDPEFTEAWNNYGYVLVKLGRKDDARKVREKINQIKKKKEETIKKSQITGKKQFGNYLP
jgi:tetratricopeptide (TPR) repeat protein